MADFESNSAQNSAYSSNVRLKSCSDAPRGSKQSFGDSSESFHNHPKLIGTPPSVTTSNRGRKSSLKERFHNSRTCEDLKLSPNFSSNSSTGRPPLKVQATVDYAPSRPNQSISRAPRISNIGRSASVRTCLEQDFIAANAYTDFYPHKRQTSFKKSSKSQTSLNSFSQNGPVRNASSGRNSVDLTKPNKPLLTSKPKLKHANTIASLTYETAELLGTAVSINNYWDPNTSKVEMPKQPIFANHVRKLKSSVRHFIQPTENRLALKLFGSKKAVLKERKRCEEESPWIIHPYSTFRFLWDFIMLMLLIANLVILPVAIAFFNEENSNSWAVFNCINDSIFIIDIILNFRTGIPRQHMAVQVVLDPKMIRKSYIRGWFTVDLISSMPMDYIFLIISQGDKGGPQILNASRTLKMLRLMKFLSLMRLLRVSRLMRYATQWEDIFNLASAAIRILNLIFMMILISHWNGCLMFLFPRIYDFPANSWVVIDGLEKSPWEEQYSWALFRAMSHMLCIGYGQQPPTSLMDLWLIMVSMLSGATCYALFIGHATNMIQQFDSSRRQYTEKIKQVEEYMGHRKLPPDLQVRVHEYYEYKYKGKMFDEEVILEELNDCLREEILNYNCRELVNVVPFFQGADPLFVSGVVSKLKFEVFQPGDLILCEGSFGTKMYFIQQGTVDVVSADGDAVAQLTDGAYFGEICLLTKCRRTASIRAESYCNVYSLEVEDFNEVVREFPEVRDKMEQVARLRLQQLGRKPSQVFLKSKFKPSLIHDLFNTNSDDDAHSGDIDIQEELVSNVARLTMRKLSVLLESNNPNSPTRTNSSGNSSGNNNQTSPKMHATAVNRPPYATHNQFPTHVVDHCDTILESDSGEMNENSMISNQNSFSLDEIVDNCDVDENSGPFTIVAGNSQTSPSDFTRCDDPENDAILFTANGFDDTICEDDDDLEDLNNSHRDLNDVINRSRADDGMGSLGDTANRSPNQSEQPNDRISNNMLGSVGRDESIESEIDLYKFQFSPSCPTFSDMRQLSTTSDEV